MTIKKALVLENHDAIYPDPISVLEGQEVLSVGKEDIWEGHTWIWATCCQGKQGWVPDNLLIHENGRWIVAFDYTALELNCRRGENMSVLRESHGWAWCRNDQGEEGWVPLRNLEKLTP